MNRTFITVCLLIAGFAVSAKEGITVVSKRFDDYQSTTPVVVDTVNSNNPIINIINSTIEKRLQIGSFRQPNKREIEFYGMYYTWEKDDKYICFSFSGEYTGGMSLHYNRFSWIFCLETGELIESKRIDFASIFSLNGYFEFLERYCLEAIKKEFERAKECTNGVEPDCSYFDLVFEVDNTDFSIKMVDYCFRRLYLSCSPDFSLVISTDSIMPYLNHFGRRMIENFRTSEYTVLKQFRFLQDYEMAIPNYFFMAGKIDGKYPFKMALLLEEGKNESRGYYYYDRHKIKLSLTGSSTPFAIYLNEALQDKPTGFFEFSWNDRYNRRGFFINGKYLTGIWQNPDRTQTYEIEITAVKAHR